MQSCKRATRCGTSNPRRLDQDVLAAVREEAERGGWSWRDPDGEEAKLRHRFLAQVVRTLWGESASYEVLMDGDEAVARASMP